MVTIRKGYGNEKILENISEEELGTQSRLFDYTTGIYTRIHVESIGKYILAESGLDYDIEFITYSSSAMGLSSNEEDDLEYAITDSLHGLELTEDEVNQMINEGFLNVLSSKNPEVKETKGFQTLLTAERLLKNFERNGSIGYSEVLREINGMLVNENISEEERKSLEVLKTVYEDDSFKKDRESLTLLQEAQKNANINRSAEHSAQEISEDLQEIARSGIQASSLQDIISASAIGDISKTGEK